MKATYNWDTYPLTLTVDQVCEIMCVTRATMSKWLNAGKLPARRIDRIWFIERDALKEYLRGKNNGQNRDGQKTC